MVDKHRKFCPFFLSLCEIDLMMNDSFAINSNKKWKIKYYSIREITFIMSLKTYLCKHYFLKFS